jgi:hypothetical protein
MSNGIQIVPVCEITCEDNDWSVSSLLPLGISLERLKLSPLGWEEWVGINYEAETALGKHVPVKYT